MLKDGWKHFMGGVKVSVSGVYTSHYAIVFPPYILKLHPGLLNPPLELLPPPVLLRVSKSPRSVFKTRISDIVYKNYCNPVLPIVPAFLWCALAAAPVPSLQALLMLLDMEEGRLASSPPERDSKLFCINLSLRPT